MITKFIKNVVEIEIPICFTCDICGYVIELTGSYDIKYESDIRKNMAVVSYSYPAGRFSSDTISAEFHCCSTECLCKAIKKVPYGAQITIPISKRFKK